MRYESSFAFWPAERSWECHFGCGSGSGVSRAWLLTSLCCRHLTQSLPQAAFSEEEEEEEEEEELEEEAVSSEETKRLRAVYGDPRRRSSREGAKAATTKIQAVKAAVAPKGRPKGRAAVAKEDYDEDDEDDDDEDDAPKKKRGGGRAVAPRARPSRDRKQVKRGVGDKELQELLGDDDDEDEAMEKDDKKKRMRKEDVQEDLDNLEAFESLGAGFGGVGGERRAETLLDRREVNGEREYFVKWQDKSHLHCCWASEKELLAIKGGKTRVQKFNTRFDKLGLRTEADELFPADFVEVDRIIDGRTNGKEVEYLVKWQALGYEHCTWESAKDLNDDQALARFKRWSVYPGPAKFVKKERPPPNTWKKYDKSPKYENDNTLRDYQLEGLNWLTFNWYHKRNTILADEMGLGKTVQAMSVLNHLYTQEDVIGPFLVIAPLSTIPHWKREFEGWTTMNAVVYHGSAAARDVIRKYELYHRDPNTHKVILGAPKFNVLITTYEMVLHDSNTLKPFKWRYLVVDEAHRLKNQDSKLINELRLYHYDHTMLMTGTPLQNNTTELWSLLNFLNPDKYASLADFLHQYGDLTTSTQVDKLHALLRPIMLRRMKEDVEKSIMPLEETIVEVELTNLQKRYYRAIYERNFAYLTQGKKGGSVPSLLNVVMQLRKSCNHPYLLAGVEEQINKEELCESNDDKMKTLIRASGKLVLIDKLLPRLKEEGHKVLIFSQFVKVLDILQDYLDYRHYEFERIDGGVRGNDRQAAIDRFSREGSTKFVFLLCTRAGGVGINLTAADTVIIFDSDWNPQNDVQAQARCHRIGQKQMVKVYRLITRNTYEKDMFIRASKKLGLDQAVLNKIEGVKETASTKDFGPSALKKDEIDALLKHGAYDVFREGKDKPDVEYDEADIARILERDSTRITYSGPKQDALASLSKAAFVSGAADNQIDMEDPDFWKKLLPASAQSVVDPNIMEGSRNRKSVRRVQTTGDDLDDDGGGDGGGAMSEDEEYHTRANFKDVPGVVINHSQDWSLSSRARFRAALLAFGFGRWEDIRLHGRLKTTVEQVQAYAEAMVEQMCKVIGDADVEGRYQIIDNSGAAKYVPITPPPPPPEQPVGEAGAVATAVPGALASAATTSTEPTPMTGADAVGSPPRGVPMVAIVPSPTKFASKPLVPDDPAVQHYRNHWTLYGEQWEAYLARNSAIVLQKLMLVAVLGAHVRKYGAELSKLPSLKVPALSSTPVSWWNDEMDGYLVMGMYRHGVGRYAAMWEDPELRFPNKLLAPGEKKKRPDDIGSGGWEGLGQLFLNERSRRLQKAILSKMSKVDRAKLREKKKSRRKAGEEATPGEASKAAVRRVQLENEWSKREKADLYRTLSSWGLAVNAPPPGQVPTDPDGSKIDWTYIVKEAVLHKTPIQVERYYREMVLYSDVMAQDALLEKRLYVAPATVEGSMLVESQIDPEVAAQREALKAQLPPNVDLSSKQVSRLLQRLRLFNKLRMYVVPKGEGAVRQYFESLRRKTGKGYPKWWNNDHDVAVVMAMNKHGFFWEDMLKDPELPFVAIWRSLGGSEEVEAVEEAAKKAAKKERKKAGATPGGPAAAADGEEDVEEMAPVIADEGGTGSKKKKRAPAAALDRSIRRDRGRRCALVDWPKDAVLFKRIEACLEDLSMEDLWYEAEGIVGSGPRKIRMPAKKAVEVEPEPEFVAAPSRRGDDGGDYEDDDEGEIRKKGSGKKRNVRAKPLKVPKGVRYDEQGKPVMPLVLSKSATIFSLGTVVTDRVGFHSEKYVWPAGFKSIRVYTSIKDPHIKVPYTCEIVDNGGAEPVFRITWEDMDEPVEAQTASAAWNEVISRANKSSTRAGPDTKQLSAVSGPEYFGFGNPFVAQLIQNLPGVDQLSLFKPTDFGRRVAAPRSTKSKTPRKRAKVMEQEIEPEMEGAWKNDPKIEDIDPIVDSGDEEQSKKRGREELESQPMTTDQLREHLDQQMEQRLRQHNLGQRKPQEQQEPERAQEGEEKHELDVQEEVLPLESAAKVFKQE